MFLSCLQSEKNLKKKEEISSENTIDNVSNENLEKKDTDEPVKKKAKTDNKSESKVLMNKTDTNLEELCLECNKLNANGEKYNIKICTWNVSGIRALLKVSFFIQICNMIIFLILNYFRKMVSII